MGNTTHSNTKKITEKATSVIVIFPFYGQFGGARKPDFGRIFCKTFFSLKVIFYRRKTELKNL